MLLFQGKQITTLDNNANRVFITALIVYLNVIDLLERLLV